MKKQSFPAREKLRIRLLAIVPAYTAAGLAVMPLLEYILSRSAGRISEWLYLRLDVLYFLLPWHWPVRYFLPLLEETLGLSG